MAKINKWFTPGIKLIPLDVDPTSLEEGDVWATSAAHSSPNDVFIYRDGVNESMITPTPPAPAVSHGYKVAGGASGLTNSTTFDKFVLSTETIVDVSPYLVPQRQGSSGYDFGTKGFTMGGVNGGLSSEINKVTFSTDVDSAIAATLSSAKDGATGVSSTTKAYSIAGSGQTNINALVHSTESVSTLGTTTPAVRYLGCGVENSSDGYSQNSVGQNNTYKFNFGTETGANIASSVSTARFRMSGVTDFSTKGYACGGESASAVIDKLTYSTDVHAVIAATLDVTAPFPIPGFGDSLKGYICIGTTNNAFTAMTTEIDDMTYATDVSVAISETVTAATGYGFGLQG